MSQSSGDGFWSIVSVTGTMPPVAGVWARTPAGCADSMAITARTVQMVNVDKRDMWCPLPVT